MPAKKSARAQAASKTSVKKKNVKPASAKAAAGKKELKSAPVEAGTVEQAKKALAKAKVAKEAPVLAATGPLAQKWTALFKKADSIESKPYNMKASYGEKTAIVHKVLGWGYILANRNDRLEVLFKDGIKYLISNYKP